MRQITNKHNFMGNSMRSKSVFIGLLSAICVSLPFTISVASDLPAVSATNSKIGIQGGRADSDNTLTITGSLATPLGHSYGLQLDGLIGNLGGNGTGGLGAHLFWRDPETGMFGLTASKLRRDDRDLNRIGFEGEYYGNAFTLSGMAGRQTGDFSSGTYYGLSARYYIHDSLAVSGNGESVSGDSLYTLGLEFQPNSSQQNISYFVNASSGSGDAADSVVVGVRLYLGKNKSLKRRHREDDPDNNLFRVAHFGMAQQQVANQCPVDTREEMSLEECNRCFPGYIWGKGSCMSPEE